jgi:hypothetical protein
VKFGISYNTGYYGADPGSMAAVARHAEACGFESFYVPEHIALYPGATGAGIELPPSLAVADPLECLSFDAPCSRRRVEPCRGTPRRRSGRRLFPRRQAHRRATRRADRTHARTTAAEAGRDPAALDYTRWGSTGLSEAEIEAHARNGTTRLVVGPSSVDLAEQRAEISAFADRLKLPRSQ